jgi:murein L,D-transpeptidase YcbB/YkuD
MEHDLPDVTPSWYRPQPRGPHQVYKADTIKDIQRTLQVPETGEMDSTTVNHIKGLQHVFGLSGDGVIDEATAVEIERLRSRYAVQER